MKAPAAGFLVFLVSCAGTSVSQEVRKLVPLIKSERYEEAAADPDLLAPAFVEALRQMNAEGADPKRVVALADFFFDNYPFALRDLPLDDDILLAAGEEHFKAASKLEPALPSCAAFQAAPTFAAKHEVLSTWSQAHRDGGRCARHFRQFLEKPLRRGREWIFDTNLTGEKLAYSGLEELIEDCFRPFGEEPGYLLIQIASQPVKGLWSWWTSDNWTSSRFQESTRWSRMHWARLAWLAALRHEPDYGFIQRFTVSSGANRFDPRISKLASAIKTWTTLANSLCSDWQADPVELRLAVDDVVRCGPETPFADVSRYSMVASLARAGNLEQAEVCAKEYRGTSQGTFHASHGLLELVDVRMEDPEHRSPDEAMRLCRMILEWDPRGYSASTAWLRMSEIHRDAGRENEMEACLVAAANLPLPKGPYEDDDPYFARSRAGEQLARLYQERRSWSASLAAWKAWEPYTWCATCGWGQDQDKSLGIAQCLEALGRVDESTPFYWQAAISQGTESVAIAKKIFELQKTRGKLLELKSLVQNEVDAYDEKSRVDHGLKWLAETLGVPLK